MKFLNLTIVICETIVNSEITVRNNELMAIDGDMWGVDVIEYFRRNVGNYYSVLDANLIGYIMSSINAIELHAQSMFMDDSGEFDTRDYLGSKIRFSLVESA